jgi:signal transduction histidine kinase
VLLIGLEALHNAVRHANAGRITLAVAAEQGGWTVVVEDDGRGLPDTVAPTRGLGLASMRRRAAGVGGRLEWSPPPGGGTRVTLHIIMRGAAHARGG